MNIEIREKGAVSFDRYGDPFGSIYKTSSGRYVFTGDLKGIELTIDDMQAIAEEMKSREAMR